MCDVEVRKLEHQVQHLTESQRHSDERHSKLKDENGHFVERFVTHLVISVVYFSTRSPVCSSSEALFLGICFVFCR